MERQEILRKYNDKEDKILIANLLDKIHFVETKNKIEYTNFLDLYRQNIVQEVMNKLKIENYFWYGGYAEAERKILLIYPKKLEKEIVLKNIDHMISVVQINLPSEIYGRYSHRDYLGGILSLGIEREKVGDILAQSVGADIIILKDIEKFVMQNIDSLKNLSKSEINIVKIENLRKVEVKKEKIEILIPSLRIDNIIAETIKVSKSKVSELIDNDKVFINFQKETKKDRKVKIGDKITVRGTGRFEVSEICGQTKSGKMIVIIQKSM